MKIEIEKQCYGNFDFFAYNSISLKKGLNVLIGCNGSGKTTLIGEIKSWCLSSGITNLFYDNYRDGGKEAISKSLAENSYDDMLYLCCKSEGERIRINLKNFEETVIRILKSMKEGSSLFILMDAVDSGLSPDNIIAFKNIFIKRIVSMCRKAKVDPYVVVASNSYEMAENEKCINVMSGKQVSVKTYSDFRKQILCSYNEKCRKENVLAEFNTEKYMEDCL